MDWVVENWGQRVEKSKDFALGWFLTVFYVGKKKGKWTVLSWLENWFKIFIELISREKLRVKIFYIWKKKWIVD